MHFKDFTFSLAERWEMNRLLQAFADRELNRAISAGEEASSRYYGILRRFLSIAPASLKEKQSLPGTRLDADGLKAIDIAWNKLDSAEKKLRNAYMKLYEAYL
jgi:hypothetical protein